MAAYASVVSLSQTIQLFLRHEHDHHQLHTSVVGDLQIESLQEHVNLLQAFLDDSHDDKATTDLEGRIRDASNAAEHMLEYLMLGSKDVQKLVARSQDVPRTLPRTRRLMDLWKEDMLTDNSTRLALASELKEAAEKIGTIIGEVMDIKNNTARVEFGDSSSSRLPPTIGKDEIMIGFDDDLLAIKSRLCGHSSRLQIIPICGMGGIGKTTLARNAYEDPSTIHRFHIRAWVTVSQDYKAGEVLSRLKVSMKAFIEDRNGPDDEVVYQSLKGRRYLIVLDDIWSIDVWNDLKRIFPDDNNGSRIMLTTRLADVVAYADSSSNLHEMHLMGEDQSWQLLQQKVFKKEHCPPQLEDIGKEIAGRCKGLPLAVVVVAGILSTISPTKASWEEVASKVTSTFNANDDEIRKIFSLSYTNLPYHLRPCFLYMGGFPEDYGIHVSKLAKLWTAEGFMKPKGSKCFEDVAEEYLGDLVKRSLVLVTRRKTNGRIKICSIHDLLRDFCIRKAEEEKFLLGGLGPGDRFGFLNLNLNERYFPTVHSVLFFHDYCQLSRLRRFRLLRVLDTTKIDIEKFPDDVLELYLIRYLAFSFGRETFSRKSLDFVVPPSISKLQNLETLLIFPSDELDWRFDLEEIRVRFPSEIWSLRRLRHLHVGQLLVGYLPVCGDIAAFNLSESYPALVSLQDLQTLATVRNFRFTEWVMQMIQNLKKLGILYDEYGAVRGGGRKNWAEEYHLHNLVHLRHLENLSIRVYRVSLAGIEIRFPAMLKKLKLDGWGHLSKQVMGIIGSLPNLEVLKLIDCDFEDDTWETTEGEFPKLKFLKIISNNLKEWMTERSHFPSLKHLHIYCCHNLREIPEGIGAIPTLELIEVGGWDVKRSLVESVKRIKEEQESYGNYSIQGRIYCLGIS